MNLHGFYLLIIINLTYLLGTLCWSFSDYLPAKTFSSNPYCWAAECCNEYDIPGDTKKLKSLIEFKVYGQPLVKIAVDAIEAHWNSDTKPSKALTLSFHGWVGSGKNYVANFIADSLYKYGAKSKFVHHLFGRYHFSEEAKRDDYQNQIYQWVKGNTTKCPKQLFIFDEVDKMTPGVLNVLQGILDHKNLVEGVDYRNCIFIFIANTASDLINQAYHELWQQGRSRESLKLHDFEHLIIKSAFNEKGGFYLAEAIKHNLIDHYIPFLPMEHDQVVECIKDQFRERNVYHPKEEDIWEVLEFVQWGPEDHKLFSKTGCKRISAKVAVLAGRYSANKRIEL